MFKPRKQGRSAASRGTNRGSNRVFDATCTDNVIVAPPLPGEQGQKAPNEEMQDFLDELLG